jgi:hypothetical protein
MKTIASVNLITDWVILLALAWNEVVKAMVLAG